MSAEEYIELETELSQVVMQQPVRVGYDSTRILEDHGESPRPLPPYPTHFLPGTEGKIRVMEERQSRGLHIHHPLDARYPVHKRERIP